MRVTIDTSLWARFKHIFTRKHYFKVTIAREEVLEAFKSQEKLDLLLDRIEENINLESQKYYISQQIKK